MLLIPHQEVQSFWQVPYPVNKQNCMHLCIPGEDSERKCQLLPLLLRRLQCSRRKAMQQDLIEGTPLHHLNTVHINSTTTSPHHLSYSKILVDVGRYESTLMKWVHRESYTVRRWFLDGLGRLVDYVPANVILAERIRFPEPRKRWETGQSRRQRSVID